jgi:arylsulfatase A-like enzyme
MLRRLLSACVVLTVAALAIAGQVQGAEKKSPPPNVVVIFADDLGYGDVGCFNPASRIATPRIDRLAAEGVRFTDAHTASSVCTPSRYALLTGRYCWRTRLQRGVLMGFDPPLIEAGRPTIASILAKAGYDTAAVGKWHVGMTFTKKDGQPIRPGQGGLRDGKLIDFTVPVTDSPIDAGFGSFFGCSACPTTDWLYTYFDGSRPTALPTEQFAGYEGFWRWNRPGVKSPDFEFENVDLKLAETSVRFIEQHAKSSPGRPFFLYHAASAAHLPAIPAKSFEGKSGIGPLGDLIVEFDWVVGQIVDAIERSGAADNTLVIVTSDNGPETCFLKMKADHGHDSAGGLRGMKRDNWEGGHRVPFIAKWPGHIAPGRVEHETLCLTDLFATFASLADAALPQNAGEDSYDMSPALLGLPRTQPIREATIHHSAEGKFAIRQGNWKLLMHQESGGWNYRNGEIAIDPPLDDPEAPGQLYDLSNDPGERKNLYQERPEIVSKLTALLERYRSEGRSAPSPGANQ